MTDDTNDSTAAIRAARSAINEAIARRDPDGIAAFLLPDYHVVTARSMQRYGRDESARSWEDMFARDHTATYGRIPAEIHVNDEWGMAEEHGRWMGTLTANDGPMALEGVYAAKWHNTAEGWRLQAEIFTPLKVERGAELRNHTVARYDATRRLHMTDRIEKKILLRAPRSRVWRAISDKTEFGTWFRVRLPAGAFQAGERVTGNITYPGYEHLTMDIQVVEVAPERRLAYRWHPYAVDPDTDYSAEPTTLVTFTLDETKEGTMLTIEESGFDQIPLHRRAEAFRMNDGGWAEQITNIERHVTAS